MRRWLIILPAWGVTYGIYFFRDAQQMRSRAYNMRLTVSK